MRRLLLEAAKAAPIGGLIGAFVGLVTSGLMLDGALFGGIIGASIGAGFAAWIDLRRDEAKRAIRGKTERTRFGDAIQREDELGPRSQDLHGPYI
jgi:predicted lipid-binding transport protein (Tim44 family)